MKHTCECVDHVGLNNRYRHKFSVECVLWYPLDTGMFTSSGTDRLLKIWDTNRLKVGHIIIRQSFLHGKENKYIYRITVLKIIIWGGFGLDCIVVLRPR